ncbi:transglutaminase family protein [Aporhodopirellula aestuarii]|uniref:Transglutaminase family protein n=1 Tax=Aporhodopirellula aestuarii TaxID=2950107 RepID=A0ABT0UCG8_9BACT|nr:transglutaminase family protein [Aporhodopirellula aestuarii]MCM2374424.1 transglutaminase family protein [Aporhodopirellula aestuarii]
MTTRVALSHHVGYVFDRQIDPATLWLRLRPAPHTAAQVEAYSIKIHVDQPWLTWVRDPFENHLGRLDLPEPFSSIGFDVDVILDLEPVNPFDFFVEPYAYEFPFEYPDQLQKELTPYLHQKACGPAFTNWLEKLDRSPRVLVEFLTYMKDYVCEELKTLAPVEPKPIDLDVVIEQGGGSARDLAWVLTQSLRSVGLAARFTSGYLISLTLDDEGEISEDESGDSARMHAWSEVFVPGAGWIGLDPSLGIFTAENHIPLSSAPDPFRTVPLVGINEQRVASHQNEIGLRRLKPVSPGKPLSETQWRDISATGRYVDDKLNEQQLGLCSSAEVNFVSARNAGAPEWTNQTLGDDKLRTARSLLNRLKTKWAPGGAVHLCQSEHIQGEASARWRLSCCYRQDGRPLWRNGDLLWDGQNSPRSATAEDARQLAERLAANLGLGTEFVIPAHEDWLHQLSNDPALLNYVPRGDELGDPLQRQRLADQLSARSTEPAGFVLPLRWDAHKECWASGVWKFRRAGLYLLPGDFSLGFRLPLHSLSKHATEPDDIPVEPSLFEEKPLLPEVYGEVVARQIEIEHSPDPIACVDRNGHGRAPRTATCVEPRDGVLHVFLPPIHDAEHYVSLIAAIESAADSIELPVVLEGYEPPHDPRLKRFAFEPDSGLLRLFLPAASSWQEQCELYETAYAEADGVGLDCEHGGRRDDTRQRPNSYTTLTLSGPTPAESPFLNRPQVLRSLIAYWQNHPSLSYFFSGTLIGPSGTAPRPDEGRDDAIYELGIALERFPHDSSLPWVPDRLLRHLLADAAGNMHRAEMRVDRLYAPERQSRRLGQIMLRSFDMPSHPRLASLQALLVRALISHFSHQPYTQPLVTWETALHDRFMLPHVLWEDFETVLGELGKSGIPLQQDWFTPLLEMNFPKLGSVQIGDITLELRRAHEPWPLLAEEITGGGMARFIDVANERIQVRLVGMPPDRYVLACNQELVPLNPGAIQGDYVAGVRYKVCQPPSTSHPTVAPVTALMFDLIDTWTDRIVGGCTYYPAPPHTWTFGTTGTPPIPELRGQHPAEPPPPPPPATLAAVSVAGRFAEGGSGLPVDLTKQYHDPRFPYSLDLTKAVVRTR